MVLKCNQLVEGWSKHNNTINMLRYKITKLIDHFQEQLSGLEHTDHHQFYEEISS